MNRFLRYIHQFYVWLVICVVILRIDTQAFASKDIIGTEEFCHSRVPYYVTDFFSSIFRNGVISFFFEQQVTIGTQKWETPDFPKFIVLGLTFFRG